MQLNTYQKTALATVGATIFLIFVGGLVRAAGAGLGCPDWPRCFGLWIPPTSLEGLPSGFDASQFNVFKTWTEYINRLIGVLVGLLIIATSLLSLRYRNSRPEVTIASFVALVLVLFQGWLGGMVVRSGLSTGIITIHMVTAMIILITLIYASYRAMSDHFNIEVDPGTRKKLLWISGILLLVTLVQIGIGTQVREAIDVISRSGMYPDRANWLDKAGLVDEIHRSSSWLVMIASGYLLWVVRRSTESILLGKVSTLILAFVLMQVFIGVVLAYASMPPAFQVLHLGFSSFLICSQFIFLMMVKDS
ncbi:MAG: COX15/CtaA family protein [Rhodothermaceae bacterium]|nr:COX15/CtaA family protein [Rhodothermaceae bacterium]